MLIRHTSLKTTHWSDVLCDVLQIWSLGGAGGKQRAHGRGHRFQTEPSNGPDERDSTAQHHAKDEGRCAVSRVRSVQV